MRHRPTAPRGLARLAAAGTGLVLAAALIGPAVPAHADSTARYIVTTTSSSATDTKVKKLRTVKASIGRQFRHVLHGFSASLTESQVALLKNDPTVESVRRVTAFKASEVSASGVGRETGAPWGLDRIDQRSGTDGAYFYNSTGSAVTAYVLDTGIRTNHTDFGARATSGFDFYANEAACTSSQLAADASHGTHVAGIIGGAKYGVAKTVSLVSVRVLDCEGGGDTESVLAGLDWVAAHHPSTPSLINMSLGAETNADIADVDVAVNELIADGIPVIVAAGNSDDDACGYSPAGVPDAITVGASAYDELGDYQPYFTNHGPCVDLFAPGTDIVSDGAASTSSTLSMSGTSMASPHVAGAVARYLETHPTATPAEVSTAIVADASAVADLSDAFGSPNKLLYVYSEKTPSAPRSVTSTRSDQNKTATVTWAAPSSAGTSAITGYSVTISGKSAVSVSASARSYTFRGLKAGTTYTLTVQAKNTVGLSVGATTKQTITALPGKPKITSASKGSKGKPVTIGVKWSKPTSGGAVKHYVVTATRSGSTKTVTVSGSARSATISGLKKSKKYTIRLRATNDSGTGSTVTWSKTVKAR